MSTIAPLLEYCSNIWSFEYNTHLDKLVKIQKRAARVILGQKHDAHSEPLFQQLGWMPIKTRWRFNAMSYMQKCILQESAKLLHNTFTIRAHRRTRTQNDRLLVEPHIDRNFLLNSVFGEGIRLYNDLPSNIRNLNSVKHFKTTLYRFLNT